ncbi:hypothetical protein CHELA1G11_13696 [Hyphomicrobiales bacterium]|nr:hypothetical protein CHELA1G2_10619 [Hyphomicrobiales bacterium]CAH1673402.1 hypothetical protein CHELA1G11_13696 [Hyphomicrobiales bacterium]
MPDLSRFAVFAGKGRPVPLVPQAPTTRGTGGELEKDKYNQSLNVYVPLVPHVPPKNDSGWNEDEWLAAFDERAAILEYDGGWSRAEAERLAREEIDLRRAAQSGNPRNGGYDILGIPEDVISRAS